MEGDTKIACSQVTDAEMLLHDTLALAGRNILHPLWVSLKERKRKLAYAPLAPFEFPHFFPSLFLRCLSRGSVDTLALQTELTRALEVEDVVTLASARSFLGFPQLS